MDARVITNPGQQFVTPMTDKLKSEWDRECVRYASFMLNNRNNCIMFLTTSSSMTGALKDCEGAPCVDHKIQNAMKHASRSSFISGVEKSCRGIVAHFRISGKVMHNISFQYNHKIPF